MQPVRSSRRLARSGTFVWLVVAVVALAGCSTTPGVPIPGAGPLVTVQMRGGMCPDGACDSKVVLERDGRVHDGKTSQTVLGRVTANSYAALDAAIQGADFVALRSKPFTGECPVAFDGQEQVFEFSVAGGTQRLASCEVEIDWSSPLFIALAGAMGEWISIPLF
jgi:hypothetical protein